jgi:hypothetical protein
MADRGVRPQRGIGAHVGTPISTFAFFAVATWRVTHLLVGEDGPGDLVLRLRRSAGSSTLGQAMDCFYCASLWVALPFAIALTRELSPDDRWWSAGAPRRLMSPQRVATCCALSGAACLLERATESRMTVAPEMPRLVVDSVA